MFQIGVDLSISPEVLVVLLSTFIRFGKAIVETAPLALNPAYVVVASNPYGV
jgi:hypothetical protein